MNEEIKIELMENLRGEVTTWMTFPGCRGVVRIAKLGNLWHLVRTSDPFGKIEAWIHAANLCHLNQSQIRRLRKTGELTLPAPDRAKMLPWWKMYHTISNGVFQSTKPNLANV